MRPQRLKLRKSSRARTRTVLALFDTGSEEGLIRESSAAGLIHQPLAEPIRLGGIGGGVAPVNEAAEFFLRIFSKWCRYRAYIVQDDAVDVDLLVGEDFLLKYGLRVNPRRNRVEVESALQFKRMTQRTIFVASPRSLVRK
ncbi:MAG: retropepsin-like aspartic protease [Planctomycetota bacterium]